MQWLINGLAVFLSCTENVLIRIFKLNFFIVSRVALAVQHYDKQF